MRTFSIFDPRGPAKTAQPKLDPANSRKEKVVVGVKPATAPLADVTNAPTAGYSVVSSDTI